MKNLKFVLVILVVGTLMSTKSEYKTPPGTIAIGDNLYIDEVEISNVDWREYLYWISRVFGEESEVYKSSIPDTLVWREKLSNNEPFVENYYRHEAFAQYPVVGISYEQALAYCKWRSDRVNELLYLKQHREEYNPKQVTKNIPVVYIYRLPKKDEWEKVASIGFSKKAENKIKKGDPYANLALPNESELNTDKSADITSPVKSYLPNKIGVYNIIGNVAEMINEKGIAKGGSWKNKPEEVSINKDFHYDKPTDWIGFRCVCAKVN